MSQDSIARASFIDALKRYGDFGIFLKNIGYTYWIESAGRNLTAIEPGHPVYCMRDVVDESAGGSGIREIRPETFRKYVCQKAGCATFGATIIVERLSMFNRRTVEVLQSYIYSLLVFRP